MSTYRIEAYSSCYAIERTAADADDIADGSAFWSPVSQWNSREEAARELLRLDPPAPQQKRYVSVGQARHERNRRRAMRRMRFEWVDVDSGAVRPATRNDFRACSRTADGIIRTYDASGAFVRAEYCRRS